MTTADHPGKTEVRVTPPERLYCNDLLHDFNVQLVSMDTATQLAAGCALSYAPLRQAGLGG